MQNAANYWSAVCHQVLCLIMEIEYRDIGDDSPSVQRLKHQRLHFLSGTSSRRLRGRFHLMAIDVWIRLQHAMKYELASANYFLMPKWNLSHEAACNKVLTIKEYTTLKNWGIIQIPEINLFFWNFSQYFLYTL